MSEYGETELVEDWADGQEGQQEQEQEQEAWPQAEEAQPHEAWPEQQEQAAWPEQQEHAAWPDAQEHQQAWPDAQAQQWTGGPDQQLADEGDASTLYAAYGAQSPGIPAQSTSIKVEFASEPMVNGTQMEFKVRNEGWISIEQFTVIGEYTVQDASGKVVYGPIELTNTVEIDSMRKYEVSVDIENIPYPIAALPDGDYTAKIALVPAARRSLKFKKHIGRVAPR
jgi:hypothetical protein